MSVVDGSHGERIYRAVMEPPGLACYRVAIGESDLYVCTLRELSEAATGSLARHRGELEAYLEKHPTFGTSFRPVPASSDAPPIARDMSDAAEMFDVGPMAAVAGAVADQVGRDLLALSSEVIVENGGDVFMAGRSPRRVRVFAGGHTAPLEVMVPGKPGGLGICTSSATVGPSLSLGAAEAVTVLAQTAAQADAAATAVGNRVRSREDIAAAIEKLQEFASVRGALVVAGGAVGLWGALELA